MVFSRRPVAAKVWHRDMAPTCHYTHILYIIYAYMCIDMHTKHMLHIYIHIDIHMYACLYVYVCMYVCMHACMYACICVCICVHIYKLNMSIYVYVYTCTYTFVAIQIYLAWICSSTYVAITSQNLSKIYASLAVCTYIHRCICNVCIYTYRQRKISGRKTTISRHGRGVHATSQNITAARMAALAAATGPVNHKSSVMLAVDRTSPSLKAPPPLSFPEWTDPSCPSLELEPL